jgi:hypothetical protein
LNQFAFHRKNIPLKEIINFSVNNFDKWKKGTNYSMLEGEFHTSKRKSQRMLKRGVQQRLLFTPKRTNPQLYYPQSRHFEVVKFLNNVPKETTGTTNSKQALTNCLELQRANSFLEVMVNLRKIPLGIHRIQVETFVDKDSYSIIDGTPYKGNLGIMQLERIDNAEVKFVYYRNGKVAIDVACSNRPFKIENDKDVTILCSFFGQVRDWLEAHVRDPKGRIVPQITEWILKQCDFNKDAPITDYAQITLPDIQLSTALQTFRLYVKNLKGNAYYRCESSLQINQFLPEYLSATINPAGVILSQLDSLNKRVYDLQKILKIS